MGIDGALIEVLNWEKYNPRGDSKRPSWFRLENELATGPGFFGLDCEIKWLWIFVLSMVSQKNGQPIIWNVGYCENLTGLSLKKQTQAIETFEKFVRLRVTRNVTSGVAPVTNERTNERTHVEQDEPDRLSPLSEIWNTKAEGTALRKVKALNGQRKKFAEARWREQPKGLFWEQVLAKVLQSDFLMGKTKSDRAWMIDFDWLIKPGSAVKILEGKYDNRGPQNNGPSPGDQQRLDALAEAIKNGSV